MFGFVVKTDEGKELAFRVPNRFHEAMREFVAGFEYRRCAFVFETEGGPLEAIGQYEWATKTPSRYADEYAWVDCTGVSSMRDLDPATRKTRKERILATRDRQRDARILAAACLRELLTHQPSEDRPFLCPQEGFDPFTAICNYAYDEFFRGDAGVALQEGRDMDDDEAYRAADDYIDSLWPEAKALLLAAFPLKEEGDGG